MGGGFGDELGDLGEPGADTTGDIGGTEGSVPLGGGDAEGAPLMEAKMPNLDAYLNRLRGIKNETTHERVPIYEKTFLINEELDMTIKDLDEMSKKSDEETGKDIL